MWKRSAPTSQRSATRLLRASLVPIAALGLALFVWLSVQVYRSKMDPEGFRAWDGKYSWIVGPPAAELADAAHVQVQEGLAIQNL